MVPAVIEALVNQDTPVALPPPEADTPGYDVKKQGERRVKGARGRRTADNPDEQPLDPLEAKTREDARRRLMDVKRTIQDRSAEMLVAEPSHVPRLAQELQRLRVAMLMMREIVEDVADPNAYRELTLLNKMMTGHDPEQEALRKEQILAEEEATERMARVGLTPEGASRMVRALDALGHIMNKPHGHDAEPADDRPAPAAAH